MIKEHVLGDGTVRFQVYARSRVRDQRSRVYVGTFGSRREAEAADENHRVTQRRIKSGELPPAVDDRRTLGDALDAWLRAIKDLRSHDEYESRMRLYVRPTLDRTPLVKITKAKLIDLRTSLKEREEPIGNATINTLYASLQAAFNYFMSRVGARRTRSSSSTSSTSPSVRSSGSSPPAKCRSSSARATTTSARSWRCWSEPACASTRLCT
jgi:hypothetical protein